MLFAAFAVLASFGMGNMTQGNSIAEALSVTFQVKQTVTGIALSLLTILVILGGIGTIAKVTEYLVPCMAVFYLFGTGMVIFTHFKNLPAGVVQILWGAFCPEAMTGGAAGMMLAVENGIANSGRMAMRYGVSRGVFSNEAGMGSTPHAHAVAKVNHPVEQGFVAMTGVFIDTFIVLNLTALVILTTKSIPTGKTGAELSQYAFSTLYGKGGAIFVAICMFFFAFSTIIGWYFFGQANIKYLFGPKAVKIYSVAAAVCVFLGSLAEVDLVWNMADCFNSLMVVPNILALFALSKVISQVHEDYFKKKNNS